MSEAFGLPTTRLSLLDAAASEDDETRQRALQSLLVSYRPGMCRYLAWRFRHPQIDPEDVVHKLVVDRILSGQLLKCYLASDRRGFRSYLKTALHHMAVSHLRSETRHQTAPEEEATAEAELDVFLSAEQLRKILSDVLRETRQYYLQRSRQRDWDAFFRLYIDPVLTGTHAPSYDVIAGELEFADRRDAYNTIANIKRRFQIVLAKVLEETLGTSDPESIDSELSEIRSSFRLLSTINVPELVVGAATGTAAGPANLDHANVQQLSSLFDLVTNSGVVFTDAELQTLYRSYAAAPLASIFEQCHTAVPRQVEETDPQYDPALTTVNQLLGHPQPPLGLLIHLKRLSRRIVTSQNPIIPIKIGLALRHVSIGLALVRCDRLISKLTEPELHQSFRTMSDHRWIDEGSRMLFEEAITRLQSRGRGHR